MREQARRRGAEAMAAIVAAFPKAEFAVYHAFFPGDWREQIQEKVNGLTNTSTDRLDIDFWNGMTSVEGYGAIRFFDSVFYKAPHKGNWDSALTYNQNRVYATFSRRFSNWDYAWSRVNVSPFAWIDEGPKSSSFDDARPPAYVSEQLLAFRKWGMGGEFANFAYAPLDEFDYSPYVSAMQNASSPAAVDGEDPTLEVTRVAKQGRSALDRGHRPRQPRDPGRASGRTTAVGSGVADLSWEVLSGNYNSGYKWRTRWSIPAGALTPGATEVTIRAVDIKGHASVAVRRSGRHATARSVATPVSSRSPKITTKPPKRLTVKQRRATVAFTFTSDAGTHGFACRLDRRPWQECSSGRVTYRIRARRRWRRHTFEVRDGLATDPGDATRAVPIQDQAPVAGHDPASCGHAIRRSTRDARRDRRLDRSEGAGRTTATTQLERHPPAPGGPSAGGQEVTRATPRPDAEPRPRRSARPDSSSGSAARQMS